MTVPMPFLSIVLPTVNRPDTVSALVGQLLNEEYPDFEIVVIDQSRTPNEHLRNHPDGRVRYVRSDIVGTCHARNLGVAEARGDIVLFLDDDSEVSQMTLLSVHAENYRDPSISGVGGRVLDRNRQLNREQRGPVCTVSRTGRVFPNATGTVRQFITAPRGGHMSFRREAIQAVGGFDERFRGNAMREETDFSLRVVKAGRRIVFDPRAEVTHLALGHGGSRMAADRLAWYRDFFYNEALFFHKHFPSVYLPFFLARKARAILACMLYYGRGRPAALALPWAAFADGWRTAQQTP